MSDPQPTVSSPPPAPGWRRGALALVLVALAPAVIFWKPASGQILETALPRPGQGVQTLGKAWLWGDLHYGVMVEPVDRRVDFDYRMSFEGPGAPLELVIELPRSDESPAPACLASGIEIPHSGFYAIRAECRGPGGDPPAQVRISAGSYPTSPLRVLAGILCGFLALALVG